MNQKNLIIKNSLLTEEIDSILEDGIINISLGERKKNALSIKSKKIDKIKIKKIIKNKNK